MLAIAAEQAGVQHRLEGMLPLIRSVQDDPAAAVEHRIQIVVGQTEQMATGGAVGLVADVGHGSSPWCCSLPGQHKGEAVIGVPLSRGDWVSHPLARGGPVRGGPFDRQPVSAAASSGTLRRLTALVGVRHSEPRRPYPIGRAVMSSAGLLLHGRDTRDSGNRYFCDVLMHAYHANTYAEWARIALYRLTDALEHFHLMIGTTVAHLQDNHISPDRIRTYVQARTYRDVEAFVTPKAKEHLDGLIGRNETADGRQHSGISHHVGRRIAERTGWAEPDREDTLEAFLAVLYNNYPDDPQAFSALPEHIRDCALKTAPHSLVTISDDDES
ncbi:hypothetical protein ABZ650_28035 [Streptomyces griseoviridis]|uniref:hypothetical protein n=1 Tax=Streptomyces griseoviridis TaxID=45398 RepID=UPI00340849A4